MEEKIKTLKENIEDIKNSPNNKTFIVFYCIAIIFSFICGFFITIPIIVSISQTKTQIFLILMSIVSSAITLYSMHLSLKYLKKHISELKKQ